MLPSLALTPGEPAGIGPELSVKLAQQSWPANLLFICDSKHLKQTAKMLDLPLEIITWRQGEEIPPHQAGTLLCCNIPLHQTALAGQLNPRNADYVLNTLRKASELALNKTVQGIITGPVHKGVINDAAIAFSGHTEFFAEHANIESVVMLLATPGMRVALVTTHLPLSEVSKAITAEKLTTTLQIVHSELISRFKIDNPRILVLGLNPHAGEGGHMGDEEIKVITPAINKAIKQGIKAFGPVSADTAFGSQQSPAKVDVLVAMYHDQGLPVLKYRGFGNAINITLGLPYIRTSVDHGTALDLAGKGIADLSSFNYALNQAIVMANQ